MKKIRSSFSVVFLLFSFSSLICLLKLWDLWINLIISVTTFSILCQVKYFVIL